MYLKVNGKNQQHLVEQSAPMERLKFEKFLADLSARLVALPPDRVDDEIRNALKAVRGPLVIKTGGE